MEIEAKLLLPTEQALQEAPAHLEALGMSCQALEHREVVDGYYDSRAWDLFQAGFALRKRWVNGRWRATLKSLGKAKDGIAKREELEADLPEGADFPPISGALAERIQDLVGKLEFVEQLRLTQNRRVLQVKGHDLELEASLDHAQVEGGGRQADLFELELELLKGPEQVLAKISDQLRARTGWPASQSSKFEWACSQIGLNPKA
ncbi:MAG: CYTH domain-containing protein [Planctomycetota bacterium]|nr:MAG: CYTH domain-containing protein [Planctomycetota bacterium]